MSNISRPNQFRLKHHDAFPTDASLRWFIFANRKELEDAGAVFKRGRSVFIVEDKFFDVLAGRSEVA